MNENGYKTKNKNKKQTLKTQFPLQSFPITEIMSITSVLLLSCVVNVEPFPLEDLNLCCLYRGCKRMKTITNKQTTKQS